MSWTQISCQYDGTYFGFLSCVFDCYVNREEPVEFHGPEDLCYSLYPLRTVVTDEAHARRVYRSFAKFGGEGRRLLGLHRRWLGFAMPDCTGATQRGLCEMYVCDPRFAAYYDREVPGCAQFLRDAAAALLP